MIKTSNVIRIFAILAVSIASMSTPSRALAWDFNMDNLLSKIPGINVGSVVCAEPPKPVEGMSASQMMQRGLDIMKRYPNCEAARYFFEIQRQFPASPEYRKSRILYIEALRLARDYNGAINEANDFMRENRGSKLVELAHYQIILTVRDQMLDSKKSQEWSAFALGVGRGQTPAAPYLMNLAFQSYLDRYPNSPRANEVAAYLDEARNTMADHYLMIGKQYYKKGEYKAAIGRFMFIAKNGRQTKAFEPALYFAIMSFRGLADGVRSGDIDDRRLQELMEMDGLPMRPSRADVADRADRSAAELEAQMRKELPNSPWTEKLTD